MTSKGKPSIESPTSLDLKPKPKTAVRCSKRTSLALTTVGALVLGTLAYGGWKTTQRRQLAAQQEGVPTGVAPATQAAKEFVTATPPGNAPYTVAANSSIRPAQPPQLAVPAPQQNVCGVDPRTNQLYRFNPDTGQACVGEVTRPSGQPFPYQAYPGSPQPVQQATQEPQHHPSRAEEAIFSAANRMPCWLPLECRSLPNHLQRR